MAVVGSRRGILPIESHAKRPRHRKSNFSVSLRLLIFIPASTTESLYLGGAVDLKEYDLSDIVLALLL